jgi:hypothetical protein
MNDFKSTLSWFCTSCGAGGIRTLVQTSSKNAFYMLILWLIVGSRPVRGNPTCSLVPVISPGQRNNNQTISTFAMPRSEHR